MNPYWKIFNKSDGKCYRQINISPVGDWDEFDLISIKLQERLDGKWIEKLNGIDERYWDLSVNGVVLTLHLQQYLGISLFYKEEIDNEDTNSLDMAYKILIE